MWPLLHCQFVNGTVRLKTACFCQLVWSSAMDVEEGEKKKSNLHYCHWGLRMCRSLTITLRAERKCACASLCVCVSVWGCFCCFFWVGRGSYCLFYDTMLNIFVWFYYNQELRNYDSPWLSVSEKTNSCFVFTLRIGQSGMFFLELSTSRISIVTVIQDCTHTWIRIVSVLEGRKSISEKTGNDIYNHE